MVTSARFGFLLFCLAAPLLTAPARAQEPVGAAAPQPATPAETVAPKSDTPSTPPTAPLGSDIDIPPMPQPQNAAPDVSMNAFGIANPDCVQWMDSCQTCARDAENKVSCSTPGIACVQADITCKTRRK